MEEKKDIEVKKVCATLDYIMSKDDSIVIITDEDCVVCEDFLKKIKDMEIEENKLPNELIVLPKKCEASKHFDIGAYPLIVRVTKQEGKDKPDIFYVTGDDEEGIKDLINKNFVSFDTKTDEVIKEIFGDKTVEQLMDEYLEEMGESSETSEDEEVKENKNEESEN